MERHGEGRNVKKYHFFLEGMGSVKGEAAGKTLLKNYLEKYWQVLQRNIFKKCVGKLYWLTLLMNKKEVVRLGKCLLNTFTHIFSLLLPSLFL